MPTYRCTASHGLLDTERKAAIAREITRIHSEVTGAATFFAQVIFDEVPSGNYFVGGARLQGGQIFVNGQIRAGRSQLDLRRLLKDLLAGVTAASGLSSQFVWIYVTELPARHMAEYGQILPEPGDEQGWLTNLPIEDRTVMLSVEKRLEAGVSSAAEVS
jgi:phenylpyruvate tautomerase PptA (4-oxalocrotonate tautomerase family)